MAIAVFILFGCHSADEEAHLHRRPKDGANSIVAQTEATNSNKVPELTVPQIGSSSQVTIDGRLSEPCWASSAKTGEFVNVGTGARDEAMGVGGRGYLLWNSEAMFVAIEIRDADIKGDFEKDAVDPHLWTESTAEIMIDPDGDGDNRDYYEIQIGPQNLIFDSQFDDYNQPRSPQAGTFGHQEWTAHVTSNVVVYGTLNNSSDRDQGYTVEAKIPWSAFGKASSIPPRPGERWRMNFYAMHNNGGVAWSPILGQGNFHKASRFGRVTWAGSVVEMPSLPVRGSVQP
jgi:hypothetical protein